MATRVGLLSETQQLDETPAEKVKRSVAEYLVRNLMAVEIGKYLFKRLEVTASPRQRQELKPRKPITYQHHIEPKIFRVNRREMEELERWANMIAAGR